MRRISLIGALILMVGFSGSGAYGDSEKEDAQAELKEIVSLVDYIGPNLDRMDYARLFVFRSQALAISESITQLGIGNNVTMRAYNELIISFKFSESFFGGIESRAMADSIRRLREIGGKITADRDRGDPSSKITKNVFNHMHLLVMQLINVTTLPNELRKQLEELEPELGHVVAIADGGDIRPSTGAAARPVCRKVEKLYPALNDIAQGEDAYATILELEGLNLFYAQLAELH